MFSLCLPHEVLYSEQHLFCQLKGPILLATESNIFVSLVEIENVSVIKALNYWQHEQQLSPLLCSIFMKCRLCTFYFECGLQSR